MLLKDFLKVYDDLVLISDDDLIVADNKGFGFDIEDFEKYLDKEIEKIEPFYERQGLYKIGVIVELKK